MFLIFNYVSLVVFLFMFLEVVLISIRVETHSLIIDIFISEVSKNLFFGPF